MENLAERRLVIFGCGYVGGALARRAVAAGMRVTGLTRNAARAAELAEQGVGMVVADLAGPDWPARVPAGADCVVNCVSAADRTPAGYRRSYVDGTRAILDWAASGGRPVGTLVYTSSTGVYPQGDGAIVDETAPTGGGSPTADILVEAENLVRGAPPSAARRAFVLRLAGIYGPGRHSLLDQLRAGAEVINGRGEHRLNLIHRDDAVGAILACLAAPGRVSGAVFNLSDGHPEPKAEVVAWLAGRLGRAVPAFDAAGPSIRRGGAGVPDRVIANGAIRRTLGWSPAYPTFREGYAALLSGGEL